MIKELEGMTDAQQASILRKSAFADDIVAKAKEVESLRQKWEAQKVKEKQAKQLYEQARDEQDELINGGPPKPSPQLKLALDTDLDCLSLPGEVQDLLLTANVETVAMLGEIIRGNNNDYESVESIPGLSQTQAAIVTSCYSSWYSKQEQEIEDEGYAVDDDNTFDGEQQESEGPNEVLAEDFDSSEATEKAEILVDVDGSPYKSGETVTGKTLGEGFHAAVAGCEPFYYSDGEFKLLS